VLCGLDPRLLSPDSRLQGMSALTRGFLKIAIRIVVIVLEVVIAIAFPDFDSIMALMGSALCFTICVILPVAFYLKIFGKEISLKERILDWVLLVVCSIMAVVGTVWAVLPKEKIGAK
jgi:solute carrier family 32 (vesicular inhibitory amino acid transporter)